jgi:hypothetical protein
MSVCVINKVNIYFVKNIHKIMSLYKNMHTMEDKERLLLLLYSTFGFLFHDFEIICLGDWRSNIQIIYPSRNNDVMFLFKTQNTSHVKYLEFQYFIDLFTIYIFFLWVSLLSVSLKTMVQLFFNSVLKYSKRIFQNNHIKNDIIQWGVWFKNHQQ